MLGAVMDNIVANWYYRYSLAGTRDTANLRQDCPFNLIFLRSPVESRWLWCDTSNLREVERNWATVAQEMTFWCELHCAYRYQFIATDLTTIVKWFDFSYTFAREIRGFIFQDEADAVQFKLTFSEYLERGLV